MKRDHALNIILCISMTSHQAAKNYTFVVYVKVEEEAASFVGYKHVFILRSARFTSSNDTNFIIEIGGAPDAARTNGKMLPHNHKPKQSNA